MTAHDGVSRYLAALESENRRLREALRGVRELAKTYTPSPDLVDSIVEALDAALGADGGGE